MRRAVVTGGTEGIGLHAALALSQRGFDVTVVGRDPKRGSDAARAIGGSARFLEADLSSLSEVQDAGARIASDGPLHLLVNNVGGMWSTRWETVDGIEASFALNHLSPVVLTATLLEALRAGAPSRIIDITSSSITTAMTEGVPTYGDIEEGGAYYGMAVTGRAKLAHLAHTQHLAGMLDPAEVTVLTVDPLGPAAAATPNAAAMTPEILPPSLRHLWQAIQDGMRPASDVVDAIVAAAVAPSFHGRSGLVLGPDGEPSRELLQLLTPEVSSSARALTRRVLAAHIDSGAGSAPHTQDAVSMPRRT